MPGKLICFEGIDGSGKSTLAAALEEHYVKYGVPTCFTDFPSHTGPIGKLVRSGLHGEVEFDKRCYLFLMIADGVDWERRIADWTNAGGVFISARHTTFSAPVYQTEDLPEDVVMRAFTCFQWRRPDMTFLVDVPAAVALARQNGREGTKDQIMEKDDLAYNERIRYKYLKLFAKYTGPYVILDGELPTDQLLAQCLETLSYL